VTIDRTTLHGTLVDAARVAARGGDLDTKLGSLAGHVPALSSASVAVVYLHDGGSELIATAAHGIPAEQLEQLSIHIEAAEHPVARVVTERRPELIETASGEGFSGFAEVRPGVSAVYLVPLVVRDEAGNEEVQGALACGFEGGARPDGVERDALGAVADLVSLAVRVARLEYSLLERADWYERVAHTDALTGLANRRTFERMLELELARAGRQGSPLCLALFDVDGLRIITEQQGGRVGDDVLRRVAATLAEQVRLVDTVARIGPDEFAVIAPGAKGGLVARRVRDAVATLEPLGGTPISVSAGVARFPDEGGTAADLLAAAERAMQDARSQGTGVVVAGHEGGTSTSRDTSGERAEPAET
jgi:diguanylate cyclase (GGDEF)-like protein